MEAVNEFGLECFKNPALMYYRGHQHRAHGPDLSHRTFWSSLRMWGLDGIHQWKGFSSSHFSHAIVGRSTSCSVGKSSGSNWVLMPPCCTVTQTGSLWPLAQKGCWLLTYCIPFSLQQECQTCTPLNFQNVTQQDSHSCWVFVLEWDAVYADTREKKFSLAVELLEVEHVLSAGSEAFTHASSFRSCKGNGVIRPMLWGYTRVIFNPGPKARRWSNSGSGCSYTCPICSDPAHIKARLWILVDGHSRVHGRPYKNVNIYVGYQG